MPKWRSSYKAENTQKFVWVPNS